MRPPIGRPAYQEVADDLRGQITNGTLAIGSAIPSTAQLCKQYEVSATVIRAAIAQLQGEGTLRGQAGKAVYVIAMPTAKDADERTVVQLASDLEQLNSAVTSLQEHSGEVEDRFEEELAALKRQVGRLQAQLVDLYSKTGHQFPRERHPESQDAQTASNRDAG